MSLFNYLENYPFLKNAFDQLQYAEIVILPQWDETNELEHVCNAQCQDIERST